MTHPALKRRTVFSSTGFLIASLGVLVLSAIPYYALQSRYPHGTAIAADVLFVECTAAFVVWMRRSFMAILWSSHRDLPATIEEMMELTPAQFEDFIATLCRRDGCSKVRVVGGSGDLAADVIADLPDRTWWQPWHPRPRRILIQAKRYAPNHPVRSPALQAVNGTYREIHGAKVAAVVTTSRFTAGAQDFGEAVNLRLVNGEALVAWAAGGRAPWQ